MALVGLLDFEGSNINRSQILQEFKFQQSDYKKPPPLNHK